MPLDKFDDSVRREKGLAQDIVKKVYNKNLSQNNARKYMSGIRMHLDHKAKFSGDNRPASEMEETVIKSDGSRTTMRMLYLSEGDSQDPTRIMELMGYDPLQWELVSCKSRRNYWDSTTKDKNGDAQKSTNHAFMITLTVKPIQRILTIDIIKEALSELKPQKIDSIKHVPGDYMLEIPIVDFHLGLLSWDDETGESYDLKIAEKLYKDTILDIVSRIKQYRLSIDKILFPIGQDFFNSDTTTNTTTRGTILDSDTRWAKMYQKGVELLAWSIEQLRNVAPVHVLHIPGNHDKMLSYCAVMTMQSHFRNADDVYVDVSPKPRMYVQYYDNLIGYSHGETDKKRIKTLMQIEAPKEWGNTKFREFHLGHLHTESVEEDGGIIFRRISTIKMTDAWETDMGFVGSVHKAQAFVWDKHKGKILTIDSFVKED